MNNLLLYFCPEKVTNRDWNGLEGLHDTFRSLTYCELVILPTTQVPGAMRKEISLPMTFSAKGLIFKLKMLLFLV